MLARLGIDTSSATTATRLVTVGSILRLARTGDTIWGTGANGKSLSETFDFTDLDVRAVRGPLTQDFLRRRGVAVPDVFGDPGLLVGHLWSRDQLRGGMARRPLTVIPNLNDLKAGWSTGPNDVDPRRPLNEVLATIAASDLVVGSSLHAVVVAESLGIPARLVVSGAEPRFKYEDYYRGSGRPSFHAAESVREAIDRGGESPLEWDPAPLMSAFPADLWCQEIIS
ncbi:polysaccharide pyruvyl transferase family protein [Clavibacter sp. MX14-G9D]|uniref:polysaccharide pyruvyl transferase family protein n=1 Tax=Clavibacter sp. MX14-G9D TaxID=3064656 RepID=UPI00293E1C80|nr:polysaccharide pyruvyl transferase family protein [Clavibacter sp. MX14-G9D]